MHIKARGQSSNQAAQGQKGDGEAGHGKTTALNRARFREASEGLPQPHTALPHPAPHSEAPPCSLVVGSEMLACVGVGRWERCEVLGPWARGITLHLL